MSRLQLPEFPSLPTHQPIHGLGDSGSCSLPALKADQLCRVLVCSSPVCLTSHCLCPRLAFPLSAHAMVACSITISLLLVGMLPLRQRPRGLGVSGRGFLTGPGAPPSGAAPRRRRTSPPPPRPRGAPQSRRRLLMTFSGLFPPPLPRPEDHDSQRGPSRARAPRWRRVAGKSRESRGDEQLRHRPSLGRVGGGR